MRMGMLEIGKVNLNTKIKFSTILVDENEDVILDTVNKFKRKVINEFSMNGTEYVKYHFGSSITIDLSEPDTPYNPSNIIKLNKMYLARVLDSLRHMLKGCGDVSMYKKSPNDSRRLLLNEKEAKAYNKVIPLERGTYVFMQLSVVTVEEGLPNEQDVEGIRFGITHGGFTSLTYMELKYFIHLLSNINMDMLAFQLIQMDEISKVKKLLEELVGKKPKHTIPTFTKVIKEERVELPETPLLPKIKSPNAIPEI